MLDHILDDSIRHTVLALLESNREDVSTMTANITKTLMEEREQAEARGEARGRLEGEARGRLEGEARGRLEGEIKGKLEVAKKLLAKGMSLDDVIDLTSLDKEVLQDLLLNLD